MRHLTADATRHRYRTALHCTGPLVCEGNRRTGQPPVFEDVQALAGMQNAARDYRTIPNGLTLDLELDVARKLHATASG